eukprot:COSAG01_NODE_5685_length_4101_cov_98.783858_5_plen_32_part_01
MRRRCCGAVLLDRGAEPDLLNEDGLSALMVR